MPGAGLWPSHLRRHRLRLRFQEPGWLAQLTGRLDLEVRRRPASTSRKSFDNWKLFIAFEAGSNSCHFSYVQSKIFTYMDKTPISSG